MNGNESGDLKGKLRLEGRVQLENASALPEDLELTAMILAPSGALLGRAKVDKSGAFAAPVDLDNPAGVELIVGPADDVQTARGSSSFVRRFAATDWQRGLIRTEIRLPELVWRPWLGIRVCVSGHVRKVYEENGSPRTCPVPFLKVEVFDVDREACFHPWLRKWWDLVVDRPFIKLPDLLRERPRIKPIPLPDPPPFRTGPAAELTLRATQGPSAALAITNPASSFTAMSSSAKSSAAGCGCSGGSGFAASMSATMLERSAGLSNALGGQNAELPDSIASRINNLTIVSPTAPWVLLPRCFYSRRVVCETVTDSCGFFRCCFRWWPWHIRNGRFRFDPKPDIIIRVTQLIDGVETVMYLDPYSSTRWNVTNAHIDLYLDDPRLKCGTCGPQDRPEGAAVFFTRVGNDEVYKIAQGTGLFDNTAFGGNLANWAYGGDDLHIHAQFGDQLSKGPPQQRYYRLSYRKGSTGTFTPLTGPLSDTRVDKVTLDSQSHVLGPFTVGAQQNLYKVRDFDDFYWYNPDLIARFDSKTIEPAMGLYTLRLEVFDQLGNKLTAAQVDYRDGTDPPPGPLPTTGGDFCDLKLQLDNQPPELTLQVPAASGECGVVPFASAPGLTVDITVDQPGHRLYTWALTYQKGITGGSGTLDSDLNTAGVATPVARSVSGAPMTAGLTGTCAFALTLGAWPLIRNGYGAILHRTVQAAIAIEKCAGASAGTVPIQP